MLACVFSKHFCIFRDILETLMMWTGISGAVDFSDLDTEIIIYFFSGGQTRASGISRERWTHDGCSKPSYCVLLKDVLAFCPRLCFKSSSVTEMREAAASWPGRHVAESE